MQKITPFLWFNENAEEAVDYYTSIFKNSMVQSISRYSEAGPMPAGTVMVIEFQLAGQDYMALNGGPTFNFTEAISLCVNCESQEEVDELWDKLSAGGEQQQCGWLKDKYGLSWQIVPIVLDEFLKDPDSTKTARVMRAMFMMKKLDIARLQQAYEGKS